MNKILHLLIRGEEDVAEHAVLRIPCYWTAVDRTVHVLQTCQSNCEGRTAPHLMIEGKMNTV
jgi:hypothetical protein